VLHGCATPLGVEEAFRFKTYRGMGSEGAMSDFSGLRPESARVFSLSWRIPAGAM
jgi:IMP dehydrogenase/GMP reductase